MRKKIITSFLAGVVLYSTSSGQSNFFNNYLLQAVDSIEKYWPQKGYQNTAFTHDMQLGDMKFIATRPPTTMCVAAQMEIIITALNIYMEETGDNSFLTFLPPQYWQKARSGSLKDLLWVNSGSNGTADALTKFGMGKMVGFSEIQPGCFVNLNRRNGSGHAVLFISYIDRLGNEVEGYSSDVKGFKYYSSQGKEQAGMGGMGYRYAFFDSDCPILDGGKKRDCGVIFSSNQRLLNCGFMLAPSDWDDDRKEHWIKTHPIRSGVNIAAESSPNNKYLVQNTTDD